MSQKVKVLLVPGLYPRGGEPLQKLFYSSIAPKWRAGGCELTVCQFGWNDKLPLARRREALFETINAMQGTVSAIGVSAGGLSVLDAFEAMPDKFARIVTVASPLNLAEADPAHFKDNPWVPIPALLREVYEKVDAFLNRATTRQHAKITSLHGQQDPRVFPQWSQRVGIVNRELPTQGHFATIRSALVGKAYETTKGYVLGVL